MAYRFDTDLEFLSKCSNEDLQPLVDILTIDPKDGKPRFTEELTKTVGYKRYSPDHQKYWEEIAAEIQTYGANTFSTLLRGGKGVLYKEILTDVCEHLKINFNKDASTLAIESKLLDKVLETSVDELSEEELREVANELKISTDGLSKQALTAAVLVGLRQAMASPVFINTGFYIATSTVGAVLATTSLGRILGVVAGPIGWGLTGAWTLADIASPAKRVTVPAVIQIAFLRKRYLG